MNILMAIGVFYPLLAGQWASAPLDSKSDDVEYPAMVSDELIKTQIAFLKTEIKDPRARTSTAHSFVLARNPLAPRLLEDMLKSEKDDEVLAEAMRSVIAARDLHKPKLIEFYREKLKSPKHLIRAYASVLFLESGGDVSELLSSLEKESNPFRAEYAWREIRKFAKPAHLAETRNFLKSPLLQNRAGAASVLGALETSSQSLLSDYELLKDEKAVLAALAEGIVSGKNSAGLRLLSAMSKDNSVQIRGIVALSRIISPENQKILVELSSDKDCETRRLACIGLGEFSSPESLNALIRALADPDFYVRTAAEDSIIRISPDDSFIKVIAGDCLKNLASRDSAIRVLGELNKRQYSEDIFAILKESRSDDTTVRSLKALDKFDFKKSCEDVMSLSVNANPLIRTAVASALGTFNVESSYAVLRKLDKDADLGVRLEAIKAIGRTGNSVFGDILQENACEYRVSPEIRSYACWAIWRTSSNTPGIKSALEKLITKAVIPVEGAPPTYDALFSRTSAFWALALMGKNDPAAAKLAKDIFARYRSGKASENDVSGESLEQMLYNFDQVYSFMEKTEPAKREVPPRLLNDIFPVNRLGEGESK